MAGEERERQRGGRAQARGGRAGGGGAGRHRPGTCGLFCGGVCAPLPTPDSYEGGRRRSRQDGPRARCSACALVWLVARIHRPCGTRVLPRGECGNLVPAGSSGFTQPPVQGDGGGGSIAWPCPKRGHASDSVSEGGLGGRLEIAGRIGKTLQSESYEKYPELKAVRQERGEQCCLGRAGALVAGVGNAKCVSSPLGSLRAHAA